MGVTLSDAVISALEDKLRITGRPLDRTRVDAICARIGALPVIDARTPEEILGYTGRPLDRTRVDAICARIGALPVIDARAPVEILSYDEIGIPR